jgi:hypothetical protein
MVLTNVGNKPIEINSIVLNSQDRCTVQPFTITDLSTGFNNSLIPEIRAMIIGQLTSGSYGTGWVFIDPKVASQYVPNAKTKPVVLQVGEKIGATADRTFPCRSIIRLDVSTLKGDIRIDLNQPFNLP